MNLNQTARKVTVWSGSIVFEIWDTKIQHKISKQTTIVMNWGKRAKSYDIIS